MSDCLRVVSFVYACTPANHKFSSTVTSEDRQPDQQPQTQAMALSSLNIKPRPTYRSKYLIQVFCPTHAFYIDLGERRYHALYNTRCSALPLPRRPLLNRPYPSFCTLTQALVHPPPNKAYTYSYVQSYNTPPFNTLMGISMLLAFMQ